MKRPLLSLLVFLVIVGVFTAHQTSKETKDLPLIDIMLNSNIIPVEVASTSMERTRGLSDRDEVSKQGEGLLFIFDEVGKHGIWMKDMRFSIDIMWFDSDGRLIHIVQNTPPQSFPNVFTPPVDALYVLETEAGFVQQYNIEIGARLSVKF